MDINSTTPIAQPFSAQPQEIQAAFQPFKATFPSFSTQPILSKIGSTTSPNAFSFALFPTSPPPDQSLEAQATFNRYIASSQQAPYQNVAPQSLNPFSQLPLIQSVFNQIVPTLAPNSFQSSLQQVQLPQFLFQQQIALQQAQDAIEKTKKEKPPSSSLQPSFSLEEEVNEPFIPIDLGTYRIIHQQLRALIQEGAPTDEKIDRINEARENLMQPAIQIIDIEKNIAREATLDELAKTDEEITSQKLVFVPISKIKIYPKRFSYRFLSYTNVKDKPELQHFKESVKESVKGKRKRKLKPVSVEGKKSKSTQKKDLKIVCIPDSPPPPTPDFTLIDTSDSGTVKITFANLSLLLHQLSNLQFQRRLSYTDPQKVTHARGLLIAAIDPKIRVYDDQTKLERELELIDYENTSPSPTLKGCITFKELPEYSIKLGVLAHFLCDFGKPAYLGCYNALSVLKSRINEHNSLNTTIELNHALFPGGNIQSFSSSLSMAPASRESISNISPSSLNATNLGEMQEENDLIDLANSDNLGYETPPIIGDLTGSPLINEQIWDKEPKEL